MRRKLWIAALALLLVCGCQADAQPAPEPPAPTQSTSVVSLGIEPVISYTQPIPLPLPSDAQTPAYYTRIETDDAQTALFAFTGSDGNPVYRIYGGYDEMTNGEITKRIAGFYPADASGAIEPDAAFADPAAETPGVCIPQTLPETLRMRPGFTATAHTGHYLLPDGTFAVYGAFEGQEAAFYPADTNGAMHAGALAITQRMAVPSYTPNEPPGKDGEQLLVVYIGSQSVVAYVGENGEWTQQRLMICSTGRKKEFTPRGTFALMQQYLYKKMGKVSGENVYSQFASRITGSYLFHSVPIGGDRRAYYDSGKKQMFTKYYEALGTPASGGCVRLLAADAYWVYMNCTVGTRVIVNDDIGPTPPKPPALIYEEPYTNRHGDLGWDPTDPSPDNPYHAVYQPEFVLSGPVADKSDDDPAKDTADDTF